MERIELENELTIQDVSIKMQIPKSTLRYWEQTFCPLIQPVRTRGGQRRYNQEHIDLFKQVVELKKHGKKIAQIRHMLDADRSKISLKDIDVEESIDSLARRIAGLVNDEVIKFLRTKES